MKREAVSEQNQFDLSNMNAKLRSKVVELEDRRILEEGWKMPSRNYCDQPKIIKTDDGCWLATLTTGSGLEGEGGQHVISFRSTDQGKSWSDPVEVESPDGPSASYAALLKTRTGRIYCFYNYNADNIQRFPVRNPDDPVVKRAYPDGYCYRVDSLGHHVFRYSDDHGRSWSEQRYHIPVRKTAIDYENMMGGEIQLFWNVSNPFIHKDRAYISLHKVGDLGPGFFVRNEGVLIASPNLLSESDPEKIVWETLPEGEIGLRAPEGGGDISAENSYVVLEDGTFFSVYRTIAGWPACCYSKDDEGRVWNTPQWMRYANGRKMKNPRAANFIWKLHDGYYLYWFHNNGGKEVHKRVKQVSASYGYEHRNPVWGSLAKEIDTPEGRRLIFSQPEIMLYAHDPINRISYPDCIEEYNEATGSWDIFLSETQKTTARVHRLDMRIIDAMRQELSWYDSTGLCSVQATEDLYEHDPIFCWESGQPEEFKMPFIPHFNARDEKLDGYGSKSLRQGLTIEFDLLWKPENPGSVLLDSFTTDSRGLRVFLDFDGHLVVQFSDGQTMAAATLQEKLLQEGKEHHISIIIDGGPRVICFVVDGIFCDGSDDRQFGWGRFSRDLEHINTEDTVAIGRRRDGAFSYDGMIRRVCLYGDAFLTSEALWSYSRSEAAPKA